MTKIPLRKESIIYLLLLGLITIILYISLPVLAIIPFIFFLFILYFFRDPERAIPINNKAIISPADGTVMSTTDIKDENFKDSKTKKISIFLSVSNVLVNKGDIVRDGLTVIGVIK
jgi:phosphatidylserine decarboxylase